MFEFFNSILFPFKWIVSYVLVLFYQSFIYLGIKPTSNLIWPFSIIGLVLLIRAGLIPVFVQQIKAQRNIQALQPDIQKLQERYKGKKDHLSRKALAQEQMLLYKKHGTNPLSSCIPMLIQMPFFFSLFQVLSGIRLASETKTGLAALTNDQVLEFSNASIFGAPLTASFFHEGLPQERIASKLLSLLMIVIMTSTQFFTQKQLMIKNIPLKNKNSTFLKQQKIMLYLLPIIFGLGGINFPIGVLIYWTITNFWTMGQQFFIIRQMPLPGSLAAINLEKRRIKQLGNTINKDVNLGSKKKFEFQVKQRQQPTRKSRKYRKK